jgi:energy-coupling factor transporter ATP-binding protein EcfA2
MSPRGPIDDIAATAGAPLDAPDLRRNAEPDGGEAWDLFDLGDECPVKPLGFLKQKNFFLDFSGQLIELGTEFRKGECMMLFGTKLRWMEARWPTRKEQKNQATGETEWIITGFDQKEAQKGLIQACAKRGIFDPTGKVRGRGAHRGDDGEIILHCGDQVLIGGRFGTRRNLLKPMWSKSGLIAGYVYPTSPALAHPAEEPAAPTIARQVLTLLQTWNWKRSEIDAHLLLCWIAAAIVGGALGNRPHAWITGPSGAGKTTLQKLIRGLIDDWGVFTEDATEAGVRQLLDQDTLAVMFDEIEPDESNAEVHMKIVKLARLAYSGGSGLRGGQDHKSKQFVARSCFLFSSIHHHELPAQDRNRIAILHLSKFPPKTKSLVLPAMLKDWGAQLRRRLVEQWHRYDETLEAYQREMLAQGYAGREQDTYGTLLACGDLLLHDSSPDAMTSALNDEPDRCAELVRQLAHVLDSARAEAEDTTERCLKYLASHRLPAKGGYEQETIGRWLVKAFVEIANNHDSQARPAKAKLLTHGLRLVNLDPDHAKGNGQGGLIDGYLLDTLYLAVANKTNKGVAEIFEGSMWRGGVWGQSLALVDASVPNKKSRFGGPPEGCMLVPLNEVIDVEAAKVDAQQLRTDQR